jgi:hypothetical protein
MRATRAATRADLILTSRAMCMQCVAQSTPMVATGLVVLRRRSLKAFLKASIATPFAWLRRA